MRKIFAGSFEQVKDAISEKYADNAYKDMQKLKFGGILLGGIFFLAGIYGLFTFSWYLSGDFEEPAVPLDVNNEFKNVLTSIWYVHAIALFLIIGTFTALAYSRKNNIKSFLIMNATLTGFYFFFLLYFFKLSQLLVNSFAYRVIYDVLFISILAFVAYKIYQNAMGMVYGSKKGRLFLVEWASENRKKILGLLVGLWGIGQIAKAVFGSPENDFETRFIGAIIEFIPLGACALAFVLIYMFGNVMRGFYLNKYSEQFREMFDVEKKGWYGIHTKL